jgi:hypothetical protein
LEIDPFLTVVAQQAYQFGAGFILLLHFAAMERESSVLRRLLLHFAAMERDSSVLRRSLLHFAAMARGSSVLRLISLS